MTIMQVMATQCVNCNQAMQKEDSKTKILFFVCYYAFKTIKNTNRILRYIFSLIIPIFLNYDETFNAKAKEVNLITFI